MSLIIKVQSFLKSIKPRVYKKKFYIGKTVLLTLTKVGLTRFASKVIWFIVVLILLLSMVFGGIVAFLSSGQSTNTEPTVITQ